MSIFIDYCIQHPILTAILIVTAVLMLIVSVVFISLPNDSKETRENPAQETNVPDTDILETPSDI